MKKFLALLLTLIMALSLVACGGNKTDPAPEKEEKPSTEQSAPSTDGETFRVGVVLPMTGGSARMGELQYEGFKLFADYYNEQGGIQSLNGMKIELILADSTGDPATGASEAERLINNEKVHALVGPYNSSVGATMQPIAEKYGVPFCISNCTADTVMMSEGDLKYTFRPGFSNSSQVSCWLNALNLLNSKADADHQMESFAMIYENTDWGNSCVDTYAAALQAAGYEMKLCESFESGSADFSTIVNKLKSADPDWVIPAMYVSDAQLFLNQFNEYGVESALIWCGGGVLTDEFITSIGDYAENQISTNGWSMDLMDASYDPDLAYALNDKCIEETGSTINENVANGWQAIGTLIDAVERAASTDADDIVAALDETDIVKGHLSLLFHAYPFCRFEDVETWDGSGIMQNQNPCAEVVMTQIVDGAYRMVYPDWDGNPLVWPVN